MKEKILTQSKENGDFKIDTFRAGGKGGQHQNTTDSGVRITHVHTGLKAESRTERSQKQNIKIAFRNLVNKKEFQHWLKIESAKKLGKLKDIDKQVEEMMNENNLKIEVQKEGKWKEEK